jgi:hypothetical protein
MTCHDCKAGIPPTPPGHTGGTGYARLREPADATVCYPCADVRERADVDALPPGGKTVLYLRGPAGTNLTVPYSLTSWTGGEVLTVWRVRTARVGRAFGWQRAPFRYYFRAVSPRTGARYYGTSPGPGMYARVTRCK